MTNEGRASMVLVPANNVANLSMVFPNLNTFEVRYFDRFRLINRIHGRVILEAALLSPDHFAGLRTIVCRCRELQLVLWNVSPLCTVVRRFGSVV